MRELIAEYVFLPQPGPSVIAAWAAKILFPPTPPRAVHQNLRFNGVSNGRQGR